MLAIASYPSQPQTLLLRTLLTGLFVLLGSLLLVVLQTERNDVLSRIANRTPNRIDLDRSFFSQVATYASVPAATLVLTQFPALEPAFYGVLSWFTGS